MVESQVMNILLILILMFFASALASFLISCACLTLATKIRANLWTLVMILGIFVLSWIRLAI